MKFVSIKGKYRHLVQSGDMRWVKMPNGSERQIDEGGSFWAEFKTGGLDIHERELAMQEFTRISGSTRPENLTGLAMPLMIDGTISSMESATEGEVSNAHEAYFPWQSLSFFDTEDGRMCPARWRDLTEETLMASADFGRDFIRIDNLNLVAPWPTYDSMSPEEIVPHALAGGYDLDGVLRYEKATAKRTEVGVPLKVALDARNEREAEQSALTVRA